MRRWIYALAFCLVTCLSAQADDVVAKRLFDEGVAAVNEARWADAARLFTDSLRERERPATRFNLILSYWELAEPLEVVRHALIFLSGPEPASQRDARARASELLERARQKLAVLELGNLPEPVEVKVDGDLPPVVAGQRAYATPGPHRLQARFDTGVLEEVEVELTAGQVLPWPRSVHAEAPTPLVATPPVAGAEQPAPAPLTDQPREHVWWRRPAATAILGGVGAALALGAAGCWWLADSRADRIARAGEEGALKPGHLHAVERYVRASNAVIGLSVASGALMTGALVLGQHALQRGPLALSIASLGVGAALLGLGGFWLIRTPRDVLEGTDIERPSRQGGGLLLSASLPFLTYGLASPFMRKRGAAVALLRFLQLGATW